MRSSKRRLTFLFYDTSSNSNYWKKIVTRTKNRLLLIMMFFHNAFLHVLQVILRNTNAKCWKRALCLSFNLTSMMKKILKYMPTAFVYLCIILCLHLFCHARNGCTVTKRHHIDACKLRNDYKAVYSTLSLLK